ncbi:MAG: hypothetical protein AAF152_09535 [Cyanobacteria bacterium P01_A01_bin.114]
MGRREGDVAPATSAPADLPRIALSVRQPSAWAIIAGHKPIENRSLGSIRAGRMHPRRIALHAAAGLKEEEFRYLYWRLERHGVACPHPVEQHTYRR